MSDIRCPMCGKPNPEHLEECQFCQARLKPLVVGSTPEPEDIEQSPSSGEPASDDIEFVADDEFPEWLDEGEDELFDATRTTQTGSLRDPLSWLDEMQASVEQEKPSAVPSPDAPTGPLQVTDWLASLKAEEEAAPAEEGALPDWLGGEAEEEAAPAEEGALPDWLSGEAEEAAPAEEGALPDWLSGEAEEAAPAEEAARAENLVHADTSSLPDIDIPDWLSGESISETPLEEQQTDWLGELRAEEEPEAVEPTAVEEMPPAAEEETAVSPFMFDEDLDVGLGDLDSGETPDWLAGVEAVAEETGTEEPVAPQDELQPSELPSWLQEMKPLEAVSSPQLLPEEEHEPPIAAGPLAGLRGVLPVGAQAVRVGKITPPSVKLNVSEGQEADIGLLRSLLDSEERPEEITRTAPVTSQRVLRWLIALVLFLVVGWSLFTGRQGNILPEVPAAEVQGVFRQVENVPSRGAVLLAFEYQPAFAGEMDVALRPVLNHLMLRGATLVSLSTSPEGALMAEHALHTPAGEHNYTPGEQYLHLGYVPGGTAGLTALTERLHMVAPLTMSGYDAWAHPALQNVNTLGDFDLIVLASDDPDTARAWVEQVASRYPETPFVVVASAQAAPMLEPYYQSGQVDGMVAGVMGGAGYERQTGIPGLAQRYGGAFSMGVLVAVGLIVLGAALQLGLTLYQLQQGSVKGKAS